MEEVVRRMTPNRLAAIGAVVAIPALVLSIYNLWEHRKAEQRRVRESEEKTQPRVKIVTKQTFEHVAKELDLAVYSCTVTNIGMVGVTISSVMLEPAEGGSVGIMLWLPGGEQPRRLDLGESQTWSIYMDEIHLQGKGEIPVTAVARDTTGTEYRSKLEDTLPLQGSS